MASSSSHRVEEGEHETHFYENTKNLSERTSTTGKPTDDNGKTFLKIAGLAALLGIVVLIIILPIYFEVIVADPIKEEVVPSESDRFDCFPEGGANEQTCNARGCIWMESNSNSPSCFYSDTDGYQVSTQETTPTGYRIKVERTRPVAEPYGTEFPNLIVDIDRMSAQYLRIKIQPDNNEPRFEVPLVHKAPSSISEADALYTVETVKTPGGLFGVQVKRKSTGKVLWDTTVGRMIFADQFLQISTRLPSEYVYGFGEHMHETFKHDLNWKSYGMFSRDQGVGTNVNLYGVHPYYTCMEGDGNAHGVLFLNSNAQDVTFQPMPALTYRTVGGLFDFHIFLGPYPEQVTSQYTEAIGRPYMPPFWALGFQLCRYGYGSLDNLQTVVDRMLATEMPYDIQYTDIDYMDRQLDFTINDTTYNGLEDYARNLKSTYNMRYIIIFDPAISGNESAGTYPPYELGVEKGVFITDAEGEIAWGKVWPDLPNIYVNLTWDWESQTNTFRAYTAFPDFFKQETKDWWKNQTVEFHKRLEFDGLWIDMNEPASFVHGTPSGTCPSSKWDDPLPYHPNIAGSSLYDKTTCMANLQHHPITGKMERHYNMHSLYGWSQSEPTLDACRESTGERCMVISRSTFPGSGKYVGHWLGDNTSSWPHLAASIIGMLEFNLFGIPYIGADICGFFQDTTEELCLRWMQLGAFYPFDRNHNGLGFKDQDPAVFGPEFVAASKKILEIRYSILPYFYTLFYDAHTTGSTVVRSLMAEFPMDLNTYTVDKQMLLGGEFLISPVLEPGQVSVEAYVPDARWFDFYTGMEVAEQLRKTKTSFDAPMDYIPLHVKGGSIIAMQTPAKTTAIQRSNGLGVLYALSDSEAPSTGHLFWDDGTSIDTIERGEYILVDFQGTTSSLSASLRHDNLTEASAMVFDHVTIMGVANEEIATVLVGSSSHQEFIFDSSTRMLNVTGLSLSLNSAWDISWHTDQFDDRLDCQPETFVAVTEEVCNSRGCIWDEIEVPGIPSCYYPPIYGTYKIDIPATPTGKGEELFLERLNKPTFFNDPVQRLKVEIETHSEHQLRVKISDPANSRYEVPLSVEGEMESRPTEPLYQVMYNDDPFSFKIIRRSTMEVIMDTSVGALIFEDQFLQISSKVSSTYSYGLGEAEHPNYKLDFDWTTQALHARGEGVKQNANLYGHHPYLMTKETNGDAHGILFLNSNAMEVNLTPLPSITYRTIGGILDFYIFMGPTQEQVVQQYTAAIGRPMMPPYWALGFQLCKYGYGSLEAMQTVVEEMRNYKIPYDVQYGDIDYMDRQLDFTIDPINYVGLSDYVDKMRNEYNMRYVIILDPAISVEETEPYPPYTEGVDQDIFVKTSSGEVLLGKVWPFSPGKTEDVPESRADVAFPDFFFANTSKWWHDQILDFYNNKMKFDGLWIDMNEPESFIDGQINNGGCPSNSKYDNPPYIPAIRGKSISDGTICMSSMHSHSSGGAKSYRHYDVHSLYGWSQAAPTMSACREATGKRCYVISRSTYPGAGKYVGHWLGDNTSKWSHLRSSIIEMFEFGLFGFSYTGADICGFFDDAEEEMCLRWSQLGAFYPFSRNHAMKGVRRQDPAAWGPDFANAVKAVLEKRYTLLPYLYTLFHHSHTSGSTVVRPLMHEFASDKATWEIDSQFLWGPALLISPVLEPGKTAVEAYVPDARWFDMYNYDEVGVRGNTVTLDAPKEHINLHLRGGCIIPTQAPATTTYESRKSVFSLTVALDDSYTAKGDLFWDDGESIATFSNKNYFYSTFSCEGNVLSNRIVHDGFVNSSSMYLGYVTIMGLPDDVTTMFLNGAPVTFNNDGANRVFVNFPASIHLNEEFELKWEVNDEWSRFDCMPDLLEEGSRTACEERNCIWRSSNTPNVPWCFYPVGGSHGYKVANSSSQENRYMYTLKRIPSPTMYGGDVATIQLNVDFQTKKRLHFKFFNPAKTRWEIPESANVINASDTINSNAIDADYKVEIENDPSFAILIRRKDNDRVMFDSRYGSLQFADQFLQISTILPSSDVFGFGEHNHRRYRHDLNWRRWAMFTRDVAPVDDWNLYGMQTFFMAMMGTGDGKCFGLYLHNTNAMDVLLQPTPALTYRVTGGVLDFYLFMGDSPEDVVREYHQLIGFPVMPPYWGLGFQLSRWDYGSLDRVKEVVDEMRSAEMPFDIQYGDIDYMDAKKSFTYDPIAYNGLPEFVDQLHDWGMRYIIIVDPGIKIESGYKAYDEGISADIFIKNPEGMPLLTEVWPGDTHHPDYTNPASQQWWTDQCKDFYNTLGVHYDALWIDMNEPANFQPDDPDKLALMNCTGRYNFPPYIPKILGFKVGLHDKTFCMDNIQYMGMHYNVHSLYGHSMSYVTYDTLKEIFPDKRSIVLTRSTFAGSGKYAQHWLGDNQSQWPQMGWSIPAMFEFNLFGFPYIGADVCGFWFNTTAEMCQRWMQVGAFYPFSRNHNGATMIPQHPTAFGDEVTESSRKVLNIRYSILPYMYTLFYRVHTQGGTVVRALIHEFPTDGNVLNQDRQFLLGPAFLITPVLEEGATEVNAYFPSSSRWFDFYTGAEVSKVGKFVSLDAPMDYINLHIRGGYILPMQKPNVTTTLARTQPLSLMVALNSAYEAQGELYWDDGEARDVAENYYLHQFSCNATHLTISVDHPASNLPEADSLYFERITICGIKDKPTSVVMDSMDLTFDIEEETNVLIISDLAISFASDVAIYWQ